MFWHPFISSFEDTTPNFSTNKTIICPLVSSPAWVGDHLHCLVPLLQQMGDVCPFIPLELSVLDSWWNCCLCTTSHFNLHITDLMWVVISLKRCVNFASQVEHDTLYPASFSISPISDGTQMLPCISLSGPLKGEGGRGPSEGPGHLPPPELP